MGGTAPVGGGTGPRFHQGSKLATAPSHSLHRTPSVSAKLLQDARGALQRLNQPHKGCVRTQKQPPWAPADPRPSTCWSALCAGDGAPGTGSEPPGSAPGRHPPGSARRAWPGENGELGGWKQGSQPLQPSRRSPRGSKIKGKPLSKHHKTPCGTPGCSPHVLHQPEEVRAGARLQRDDDEEGEGSRADEENHLLDEEPWEGDAGKEGVTGEGGGRSAPCSCFQPRFRARLSF